MFIPELLNQAGLSLEDGPGLLLNGFEDSAENSRLRLPGAGHNPNLTPGAFMRPVLAHTACPERRVALAVVDTPTGARCLLFADWVGHKDTSLLKSYTHKRNLNDTPNKLAWTLVPMDEAIAGYVFKHHKLPPLVVDRQDRLDAHKRAGEAAFQDMLNGPQDKPEGWEIVHENWLDAHGFRRLVVCSTSQALPGGTLEYELRVFHDYPWTQPSDTLIKGNQTEGYRISRTLFDACGMDNTVYELADDRGIFRDSYNFPLNSHEAVQRHLLQKITRMAKPSKELLAYKTYSNGALLFFRNGKGEGRWGAWLPVDTSIQLSDVIYGLDSQKFADHFMQRPLPYPPQEFYPGEAARMEQWLMLRKLAS